jgi:enoyl-CoA hydratase/carnithine racemase
MDVRLASESARFGFVFSRRGMCMDGAASWFLPRVVGISRALECSMSGRIFYAAEALEAGLALATYTLASASEDRVQARRDAAAMIAFYGSVKSYAPMFAGFEAEAAAIREAFARGDAGAMVAAVTKAIVDELAVAGTPDEVREQLRRCDGIVDEVVLSPPSFRVPPERVAENLATLTRCCAP